MSPELLARQRLLACDVDGVLTEGSIVYGSANQELKVFNILDGLGMRVALLNDLPVVWLAKRRADAVAHRAAELNVQLYQGMSDKAACLRRIAADRHLELDQITYIGDDLDDIPPMRLVGVPIAVANAAPEVRDAALCCTAARGGQGAVREVIEMLFRARGNWSQAVEVYLNSLAAPPVLRPVPSPKE